VPGVSGRRVRVITLLLSGLVALAGPAARAGDWGRPSSAPIVGPERSVGDPVTSGVRNNQMNPAVSWGQDEYLVVWEDRRAQDVNIDIWAARVTADGRVLDGLGIPVAVQPGDQLGPAVAFDGTNFLVVWWDEEALGIVGARIDRKGHVLDPRPILISAGSGAGPAVAWSGSSFMVTWADARLGTSDVFAARVASDGTVLDPDGLPLWPSSGTIGAEQLSIGWNGVEYLIAWADVSTFVSSIEAGRIDARGSLLDVQPILVDGGSSFRFDPTVAVGGDLFFVSFSRQATTVWVSGSRVTTDGVVLDPDGLDVGTSNKSDNHPSSGWDGQHFLVAWDDYTSGTLDRVHAARVAVDGTILDPDEIEVTDQDEFGDITSAVGGDGSGAFVTWSDDVYGEESEIHGARVDQDGMVIDPNGFLVSTSVSQAEVPEVASDGANYLVVWEDNRNGDHDVFATRVTARGEVQDGSGIPVATSLAREEHPVVTWDGTTYLVVWERLVLGTRDVYGARVSADGTVLDDPPILISGAVGSQAHAAIASNGSNSMVVWEDDRNGPDTLDIYGSRVGQDGTVLDPQGVRLSFDLGPQSQPGVTSDGDEYLVAWRRSDGVAPGDIAGTRVSTDGQVLDDPALAISLESSEQARPGLTWDGTNFFVAWDDHRSGGRADVYGARVGVDGTVFDPDGIAISTAPNDQLAPTVAWDGSNDVVVWSDRRSGSVEVMSSRVSIDGTVIDPDGLAISSRPGAEVHPSSTSSAAGRILIVYQRKALELPFSGADRSFLRIYGEPSIWST
jgi:hypothetical protein